MMEGLVSVVITTYKRKGELVQRAIDSALNQTYKNIEIIIIDDNPDSGEYSESIKEIVAENPIIRYIKNDGNKGSQISRNNGIAASKGEFVAFLDDDDTWEPEKLEKQIPYFKEKNVGLVFCNGYIVDENYEPPKKTLYSKDFIEVVTFKQELTNDEIGATTQLVMRRSCFDRIGMFDTEMPARQDYEMCLRFCQHYDVIGINEALFNYYLHKGEQISKSLKKALDGYKKIYSKYKKYYDEDKEVKYGIFKKMQAFSCKEGKRGKIVPFFAKEFILDPKFAFVYFNNRVKEIKEKYRS